jgi:hypothetical protein
VFHIIGHLIGLGGSPIVFHIIGHLIGLGGSPLLCETLLEIQPTLSDDL